MRKLFSRFWQWLTLPFRRFWHWLTTPFRRFHRFLTEEPNENDFGDIIADTAQDPSMLFDHIEDLRKHLLRSLLVTIVTVGISLFFANDLMKFLAVPLEGGLESLQAIAVTENIGVFMRVGLLAGIIIALPYIVIEIYFFIASGLSARARRYGLAGIPLAIIFFYGGVAFAYYLMLPTAMRFLLVEFGEIPAKPTADSYFTFITNLLFWIGVSFEFPLVIWVLSGMGFVKPRMLAENWRIAVIIIAVIAAMVTPTVDPVNMGLVMAPMIVLYFFSIFLSFLSAPKRNDKIEESG